MSGICDTCRRKPCPVEGEGYRRCDFYEGGETRYEKMFGTPERAARTLRGGTLNCRECLIREECAKTNEDRNCMVMNYNALLEWLRGDA